LATTTIEILEDLGGQGNPNLPRSQNDAKLHIGHVETVHVMSDEVVTTLN
jgi:hypothetical protein